MTKDWFSYAEGLPIKKFQIDIPYGGLIKTINTGEVKWDNVFKTWYIDDISKLSKYKKWLPKEIVGILLPPLIIIEGTEECWKCGKQSPVITLTTKSFYSYVPYIDEIKGFRLMDAEQQEEITLFSSVTYIPHGLGRLIQHKFPFYKCSFSRMAGSKYWANHCSHCGVLFGDFYLYGEPDGAFFKEPDELKDTLTVHKVEYPYAFAVQSGVGYNSAVDEWYKWYLSHNRKEG